MRKLLTKIFIPHEVNGFHPHATRHHSILSYALVFALFNYVLLPVLGFKQTPVLASNLSGSDIIKYANQERRALGLVELNNNALLANAAVAKANDMFAKQYWDHYGPNGESPWQFIRGAGYNYVVGGENLGKDFQNSIDLHNAWMNSPTHRTNIVNKDFRDIGIGIVSGTFKGNPTTIVVQMFGVLPNAGPATNPAPTATPKPVVVANTPTPKPVANTPVPTRAPVVVKPKPTNVPVITATPLPTSTPTPTPEILSPPRINSPTEGSILNTRNVRIEGLSESGDSLKVFSNDTFIGELPKGEAAFSINTELLENSNNLYLIARNSFTNVESSQSNRINLTIDSIKPDLSFVKIKVAKLNNTAIITLTTTEKLDRISYLSGEVSGSFLKDSDTYLLNLDYNKITDPIIRLDFVDLAGNVSQKDYDLRDYLQIANLGEDGFIAGSTSNSLSSRVKLKNLVASIGDIPGRQKFNILFILTVIIFLAIDNLVLLKKGIHRNHTSYHSFNLSIMFVVLIGAVTQII